MAAAGLDALIVSDPANMNYLTGYDGWSFYVHQCVIVAQDLPQPIWIGRGQDANGARLTTILPAENIVGYSDDHVQSTVKHPMQAVARVLTERGLAGARIGVEADNYYFTAKALEVLKSDLPSARFEDAGVLVNWVRAVKSDAEIALMRQAARIAERIMQTAIDDDRRRHAPVRRRGRNPGCGRARHGGLRRRLPGDRAADADRHRHVVPAYHLDGCAVRGGDGNQHRDRRRAPPLSRADDAHALLGTPPEKMRHAAEVVVEGIAAGLAAAKPGALARDVHAAWTRTIERHGLFKDSRCGYSVGLNYPPDWGERTISLRSTDETVLEPNMTIHFMPGIWLDDWGISISEPIRITETGVETFCDFPRRLFVK